MVEDQDQTRTIEEAARAVEAALKQWIEDVKRMQEVVERLCERIMAIEEQAAEEWSKKTQGG